MIDLAASLKKESIENEIVWKSENVVAAKAALEKIGCSHRLDLEKKTIIFDEETGLALRLMLGVEQQKTLSEKRKGFLMNMS